jgi:hypothetical protein
MTCHQNRVRIISFGQPRHDSTLQLKLSVFEDETLLTPPGELENTYSNDREQFGYISDAGSSSPGFAQDDDQGFDLPYDQNGFSGHDEFSFDNFDETFGSETFAMEMLPILMIVVPILQTRYRGSS